MKEVQGLKQDISMRIWYGIKWLFLNLITVMCHAG